MGKPVILSDRCGSYGPTDDVEEAGNGIVFPFGNITALASAIERLTVDEVLRQNFSEESHARAVSFQHMAHHGILERLVECLVGGRLRVKGRR
jgi:glycosyltransferase involved in cell wall biosynthesis